MTFQKWFVARIAIVKLLIVPSIYSKAVLFPLGDVVSTKLLPSCLLSQKTEKCSLETAQSRHNRDAVVRVATAVSETSPPNYSQVTICRFSLNEKFDLLTFTPSPNVPPPSSPLWQSQNALPAAGSFSCRVQ